jgi:signal transduction histidine kinase
MAHLGHWRLDLKSGHITWSDEMYRIFGLDRDDPAHTPTMDDIRTLCHPADLEVCIRSFEPFEQETGNAMEFRIRRPNGDERHVVSNGELQRDEHGAAVAVFGTLLDMSDLRLKERELQEKNTELERFTYMISHDLKSPLITVRTFLGYLEQDLADSEYGRIGKDLHYIRTAADRMSRMLDDLLEMSRIGRMVNAAQDCTFRELVDAARDMVAGRIAERGVEVLVGEGDVALYGDRQRLVEIWQNLLENACKFMGDQAHPRIEVGAEGRGRDTVFFVRDNGMGIEPQYHEKIFGLFEKLDKDVEGTGLGLALVRRIVELNGGKIWIESQGSGQGACFRFTLPEASRVT